MEEQLLSRPLLLATATLLEGGREHAADADRASIAIACLGRCKGNTERKWTREEDKKMKKNYKFHSHRSRAESIFSLMAGAIDLKARCYARFSRAQTRPPRSKTTS